MELDKIDKAKLKVLIKKVLIDEAPKSLTASQITSIINEFEWGFKSCVNSKNVSKLLQYELNKSEKHFMEDIKILRKNGKITYYI